MVHMPTGIEVRCTEERTQQRNRERALEILTAKVDVDAREREANAEASLRRSQIGREIVRRKSVRITCCRIV